MKRLAKRWHSLAQNTLQPWLRLRFAARAS